MDPDPKNHDPKHAALTADEADETPEPAVEQPGQSGPQASEEPAPPRDQQPEGGQPHAEITIPQELPVLAVRNLVVFPGTVVPLNIGREKSKRLIEAVAAGDKLLAIFTQRKAEIEDPGLDDLYRVGTACQIIKLIRNADGTSSVLVHGIVRVGLERLTQTEPFLKAIVHPRPDAVEKTMEIEALTYSARRAAERVIELSPNVPEELTQVLRSIDEPAALADFLAANLSLGVAQKQELLETFDVAERLRKITALLQNQLEVLELAQKIQADVRKEIDKSQREYFLQEQLKAIQRELGESDPHAAALEELSQRIESAGMPDAVLKEARREFERLKRINPASPEVGVIRDYLEWLIELPWNRETEDNLDLERAERVLNEDHYGLEKVKRRILEYLAVRKLNPQGKSPILCFAGPPGVGKTSLGQSIARALGRKFIRIALGGVRDEADIRGHRRTYIGAIPGRIIQEIRKAGTKNPVMMLDELDKIGADFRGDPAAALLEVLDPEQNHAFTDHYLGVPFDLSRVFFIGTCNYIDPVEPALKDRMEVIELPGYTNEEKLEIARRYLVPRQLEQNGIADAGIRFEAETLRRIIDGYTREAGVRNLERSIGAVCRGLAAKIARGKRVPKTVKPKHLEEYLGKPKFEREVAMRSGVPGVATGLAYTPVGGEIIFVESTIMPGRGGFMITGQVGDVMKESAQAALSLLRSRSKAWRVPVADLPKSDVHIHVPAGAIPKDGPSAGVAILVSLLTALRNIAADPSVGMTGEITLRGLVLPVGGIKEKVLAAHRAGLRTVILPKRNEADLEEVPKHVRDALRFVFVERVEEALAVAVPDARIAPSGKTTRKPRAATTSRSRKTAAGSSTRRSTARGKTAARSRRRSASGRR